MKVIKRNGSEVDFSKEKIKLAVLKAFIDVDGEDTSEAKRKACEIANSVESLDKDSITIEEIQEIIENKLMSSQRKDVARAYIEYRHRRDLVRKTNTTDKSILELIEGSSDYWNKENANKDASLVTVQRDYLAGITSTDITKRFLLPPKILKAHEEGIIHFHDADYFAQSALANCCLINLEDMLQNGTVINGITIDKPHRLITATTIATQIITAVTSSQYGGATISLTHLAPFVRDSYNLHLKKHLNRGLSKEDATKFAKEDIKKEIEDSVQTFNYQCNSMTTTNGQSPFLSVFMYLNETSEYKEELAMLIEEFLKQRIVGLKNEVGIYITPAFPKLLYVLEDDNTSKEHPYWYLTELAAKCTAKRMVPDYISEKIMLQNKIDDNGNGNVFGCMGCRSFLTPYLDENGKPKYYGRMNQGVVTLNLVDVALSSDGDKDKFWKLMKERTDLAYEALMIRHNRLKDVKSDVAPILWQHGAYGRLKKGETINKFLYGGYSTISLGYAGLYECVKYMTSESHSHGSGKEFGLEVMQYLNDRCEEWKAKENIDFSVYGSPIESTTYKFASCLKKRFGVIKGITDKDYVTNSYHVNVTEKINPFDKLSVESEYQRLSPGGAISYIETANLTDNTTAVLEVMNYIYNNIMYAELNCKSDYCQKCEYDGEIKVVDDNGELVWECPNCGNRDFNTMDVARRVCGYIGVNLANQGRMNEYQDRYVHLDNHEVDE